MHQGALNASGILEQVVEPIFACQALSDKCWGMLQLGYPPHNEHNPRPGFRGTSLQDFHDAFPDDEACLLHIFRTRYGSKPPCPQCERPGKWYRISGTTRFQHPCGKSISPRSGTLVAHSLIRLKIWFYAMLHFANSAEGVNSRFIGRHLGLSPDKAYKLGTRIRMHLAAIDQPAKVGVAGETVLVRLVPLQGLNVSVLGGQNKATAFFVADDRRVLSTVVGRARRSTLRQAIQRKVTAGAIPITDCSKTYSALSASHSRKPIAELVSPNFLAETGQLDTIFSFVNYMSKPMRNNYRRVAKDYLWRYLKEFEFKYNRRYTSERIFWDMVSQFPAVTPQSQAKLAAWNSANFDGALAGTT
ncbi:MAG: transposase [Alteraurantiacibacter sp. bin_em_oilr2.035]|nr:transposase [Alteraurantiacibacter sp. bin_em_oilr2.035]